MVAGRYLLLDQVGTGGMGSVWRAYDERTRLPRGGEGARPAQLGAAGALRARAGDPGAPPPRRRAARWAAEDDLVVLAMELVPGGSVADLLREHGPFDAGTVRLLVEQLLMGLAAVHGAGLVHRDVKPANLLLEATGEDPPHLRLGDFGVAAPIADRRFTTVPGAIGTDGYMAPEQARGAPPEPTQDLYAVGRVAARADHRPAARRASARSRPTRCGPLVERLLVTDPEQRVATAEAALRLLRRLPVPPADPPAGARPARPAAARSSYDVRGAAATSTGPRGRPSWRWSAWSRAVCASS